MHILQVKRTSITSSSAGDSLVVVEGVDSTGEARVYSGTTSGASNVETPLPTFSTPRYMNNAIQQVRSG